MDKVSGRVECLTPQESVSAPGVAVSTAELLHLHGSGKSSQDPASSRSCMPALYWMSVSQITRFSWGLHVRKVPFRPISRGQENELGWHQSLRRMRARRTV